MPLYDLQLTLQHLRDQGAHDNTEVIVKSETRRSPDDIWRITSRARNQQRIIEIEIE